MITLPPAVIGLLQGLGVVLLPVVLSYFADATHLQGIVSPAIASLIAIVALGLEQHVASKTGTNLFGAVKSS